MANFKLSLDDFESNDFELLAIHTNIKDFKLSYYINIKLNVLLAKNENEISIKSTDGIGIFSRFSFEDVKQYTTWELIKNITFFTSDNPKKGLFTENELVMNLIPELKKVDYLLKIENIETNFTSNQIIQKISTIPNVSAVYKVETTNIKSINNLIF